MIKIEFEIDDIDYNELIEHYLPCMAESLRRSDNPIGMLLSNGMTASVAKTVLQGLPEKKKEQLAADFINGNRELLSQRILEFAKQHNAKLTVSNIKATAK